MRVDGESTVFRLKSARGHLDAVVRMAESDRYCIDVLHQISAVQGALEGVRRDIIEAHLKGCVPEAVAEGRVDDIVHELMVALFGSAPARKSAAHACATHEHHESSAHHGAI